MQRPRILYFDIDGVLLDYGDNQRPLLIDTLQPLLQQLEFEKLVCVSGWADPHGDGSDILAWLRGIPNRASAEKSGSLLDSAQF